MGSTHCVLLSCLARGSQRKGRKAKGEVQERYSRGTRAADSYVQTPGQPPVQTESMVFSMCLCETFLLPALPETQPLAVLGRAAGKLWAHRGLGHGWLGQTFRKGPSE